MKKLLLSLVILVGVVSAQELPNWDNIEKMNRYSAHYTANLSSTAAVVTLAVPIAATNKKVYPYQIIAESAVETTFTVQLNGTTIPTTTAATTSKLNTDTTALATVYSASNANLTGAVTILTGTLLAKTPRVIDLRGLRFTNSAISNRMITLSSASLSGVVNVTVLWAER